MPYNRARSNRLISNMDVTAFAAVMLVLAMVMMAPGMSVDHGGVSVDLPRVTHPRPMRPALREDAIIVAVTQDGRLYFGSDRIDPYELPELIRESIGRGAERRIYIKADERARYGAVKRVLDQVRQAGVSNVAFLCYVRRPNMSFQ